MSAENKVPAIRFKGFSGEWEEKLLGDTCEETYGGGTPSTSKSEYWNGDIPWIQSSDLVENKVANVESRKRISENGLKNSATKLIPENSIAIVTRVGVGKLALMKNRYATSQDFLSLSKLKIDCLYGVYSIWKKLQSEKLAVQGTSIKGLTKEELLTKKILIPSEKTEQTKIGHYFQQLDTLIAQHQQKHDKLLNLKKALLEKMFPKQGAKVPEIRFKGFSGEWEEKKLNNIIDGLSGGASIAPSDYQEKGIRTIPKGAVNSTGVADLSGSKCITLDFYEKNILSKVSSGDLVTSLRDLVPTAPNMGRVVKIQAPKEDFLMPQGVYKIVLEKGVNENFVIAYSNSELFRKIISREKNGSTQVHIRNGEFLDIEITKPKPEEQTKIGNLFKQLDTLLNQHQTQLKKLNNIKQACLEKMFV
jgi:type I restriction enzyme S subunit